MSVPSPNPRNVEAGGWLDFNAFEGIALKYGRLQGVDLAKQQYLISVPTAIKGFIGFEAVGGVGKLVPVLSQRLNYRGDLDLAAQPTYQRIPPMMRPKTNYG